LSRRLSPPTVGLPNASIKTPKTRDNVCKASDEVEPKNEGHDVAGGGSFFCAAKQGLSADANGDDAEYDRD